MTVSEDQVHQENREASVIYYHPDTEAEDKNVGETAQEDAITKFFNRRISRKNFIKGAVVAGASAAVGSVVNSRESWLTGLQRMFRRDSTQAIDTDLPGSTESMRSLQTNTFEQPKENPNPDRYDNLLELVEHPDDPTIQEALAGDEITDLVSGEILLEKYKTRIWQLPDVELLIRTGALKHEEVFKLIESGEVEKLNIILLDADRVESRYLTDEQKKAIPYLDASVNDAAAETLEKARAHFEDPEIIQERKDYVKYHLERIDAELKNGTITKEEAEYHKIYYNEVARPYLDGPTEEDLKDAKAVLGLCVRNTLSTSPSKFDMTVIVAMRNPEHRVKVIKAQRFEFPIAGAYAPNLWQSYPDMKYATVNPEHPEYPVGVNSIGTLFVLRHEMAHAGLIGHPAADWVPYSRLTEARAHMEKFGDDSLYYYVLKTKKDGNIYGTAPRLQRHAA